MFSDQKSIGAGIQEKINISLAVNPALDDKQAIIGNQSGQAKRSLKIDIEGFQVAVIHANDRCASFQRFTEFGLVMDFNQDVQPEICWQE